MAGQRDKLKQLVHSLHMENLEGVDEIQAPFLRNRIRDLPSGERIDSMSPKQISGLRKEIQELQFSIDNARNKRTRDYAVRHMVDKGIPTRYKPVLAKNWYSHFKNSQK